MAVIQDVLSRLESIAPIEGKMEFDNVGLLVGRREKPVTKILTALDITDWVIDEAKTFGAELIVSHHPVVFSCKSVTGDSDTGCHILSLAEAGIAAICMHTNLDAAAGGVNDVLAERLGVKNTGNFTPEKIGKIGQLGEETTMDAFLPLVKARLSAPGLKYFDAGRPVHRVAVLGGSGGGDLEAAAAHGCDTYVTADVKYHVWLLAKELGVNLIDAGHFETENQVVPVVAALLGEAFPEISVKISENHGPTAQYFVG